LSQSEYISRSQKKHRPQEIVNGHDHPVADLEVLHRRADLDHLPHELMPEDVPLLHGGDVSVVEVEVGPADRRRRDLHDRVARVEDLRVGHGLDLDLADAFPAEGLHGATSLGVAGGRGPAPPSNGRLMALRYL
jgi:hypothetical protein